MKSHLDPGAASLADPALVESSAGDLGHADVIFIFGTPHWTPAEVAVELFRNGLAPIILATGGSARHPSGLCEATMHRSLMVALGVPQDRIICEVESANTHQNVQFAKPLLERIGPIRTILAVVKWYHRRALVNLAEQMPTVERIYAADYEPFNWITRRSLSRATWRETCPMQVHRETAYLVSMKEEGRDLLQRTASGWIRAGERS